LEVLDSILFDKFKFHFLEPMAEVHSSYVVKINPNLQQKDVKKLLVN